LPRYVALINGESEEFVDLDHQLLVHAFVGEVIIRGARQLVEVFPDPNSTIVKGPKGGHSCEMVLAFIRDLAAEGHSETLIVD